MKDNFKIAILRANAVGDFVVTLPAIRAIRTSYPNAEIVLLGRLWHKKFLIPGRTPIDRVIVVPVMKGIREDKHEVTDRTEIEEFFNRMERERFDIAMHFQGNGVSANPFLKRLNARLTVGLTSEKAESIDRATSFYYYQSEVLRYLEVAALIGARTDEPEPMINVLEKDEEEIKGLLSLLDKKPFVVLHPFAVDHRRMWPLKNYTPLADLLKEKGFEVVFTGSQEEFMGAGKIIDRMKATAVNTCGTVSLGGMCAILKHASLVIGGDTGPLHLAQAVGTPTVGIYWAPNLINWGPLTRNIHRPVISWNMTCPICGTVPNDPYPFEPQSSCAHEVSFIRDVTVSAVMEAAESILFKNKTKEQATSFCF